MKHLYRNLAGYYERLKMLTAGFLENDIVLIRNSDISVSSIIVLTGLIGLLRHCLELAGGCISSCSSGYWWNFGSLTNTIMFSYLLVFFGAPLITIVFRRFEPDIVMCSLRIAIPFLFFAFLIVPFFNTIFNYNFLNFPTIIYHPLLPTFLYVPVGSFVGFGFVLFKGTKIFSKLFGKTIKHSFARIFLVFIVLYVYTYIIGIALTWGPIMQMYFPKERFSEFAGFPDIQFYTSTFNMVLLVFMPMLRRNMNLSKKDNISFILAYVTILLLTALLLYNAYSA